MQNIQNTKKNCDDNICSLASAKSYLPKDYLLLIPFNNCSLSLKETKNKMAELTRLNKNVCSPMPTIPNWDIILIHSLLYIKTIIILKLQMIEKCMFRHFFLYFIFVVVLPELNFNRIR